MHFELGSWGIVRRTSPQACVSEETQDDCKDPDALSKVDEIHMVWTMNAIKEYLGLHCGVKRAPFEYVP